MTRPSRRRSSHGWRSRPCSGPPIGTLSKGQRKRALLAIGLLTPQPLLLCDEPFDGLDLKQTREVGAALREHAAAGRTLFLSIHQIGDAARVCDRFVLLSGGRVCGEGTLGELAGLAASAGGRVACGRAHAGGGVPWPHVGPPSCWLLAKEWRELLASRAWWVLLVLMGPLVGVSFISAVRTYAELSGYGGTAEGVGEAFSPLVGIWAPTFSACELAAAFLLPFVAIRLVAGDKQSGALKLELQQPMPVVWRVAAKAIVLMAGWLIASLPTAAAVVLWRGYGGSIYAPELAVVLFGHLLERGPDDCARRGGGLADRPSVYRRDPHAQRHGRHVDRQFRRRRAGRRVGVGRRVHADGDGRGVPARPGAARRA